MQWIRTPESERSAIIIAQSVAATEPLLRQLNTHLSQHTYMSGERFTMADIPIACEIHRWFGLPQACPSLPNLERWYADVSNRPATRGVFDVPLA